MAKDNKSKQSNSQKQDGQKMSRSEAGRLGGQAPHECRGFGCPRQAGSMSPEEAGRLGGKASHSCRGQECNEGSNKSRNNRR